jgi:hypothetical protein
MTFLRTKSRHVFSKRIASGGRACVAAIVLMVAQACPAAAAELSDTEIARIFEEDAVAAPDYTIQNVRDSLERTCSKNHEDTIKNASAAQNITKITEAYFLLRPVIDLVPACVVESKKRKIRIDYAHHARVMGLLLALRAIKLSEIIEREPSWKSFEEEMTAAFDRAVIYLKFAKSHGQPDAEAMLARLEDRFSPKAVNSDAKPDFVLSAEEAAGQLGSNEIAFEEKYKGKLLEIHGPVNHLSRPAGRVSLFLLSASSKAKDELEDRRDIECQVAGDEVKKITSLKKGMIIKVRGIYKTLGKGNTNSIPLAGCLIVSAKSPTPGVSDPLQ